MPVYGMVPESSTNRFGVARETIFSVPVFSNAEEDTRLRAVESNQRRKFVMVIGLLAYFQAFASIFLVFWQIVSYAVVPAYNYKPIDTSGIAIWGPLLFFSVAISLSCQTTKRPSGSECFLRRCAMGFQIVTAIVSAVAVFLGIISIVMCQPRISDESKLPTTHDNQIPGKIFYSFMTICSAIVCVLSLAASIIFCRASCCSRTIEVCEYDISDVFDEETLLL